MTAASIAVVVVVVVAVIAATRPSAVPMRVRAEQSRRSPRRR
jgi:hypothetical protein